MVSNETETYLAEAACEGQYSTPVLLQGLTDFIPHLHNVAEQANALHHKLQLADLVETVPEVQGKFEEAYQRVRTIARLAAEVQEGTRQLARTMIKLAELNARIHDAATHDNVNE